MRVTLQERFSARVHSEINDCWFSSILCLSDQWIILVDKLQLKIKIYNGNCSYISSVETPYMCGGVTSTDVTEIAVTCAQEIIFYQINNGKAELLERHIELSGTGSVLKFDGEHFGIIICDILNDSKEIQILDPEGQLQESISGQILGSKLKDVREIEMNRHKKELYVTDICIERVVCLSYSGKPMWEINIKGGPHGLLLREDRLLVSVLSRHCLFIISTSGHMCGEIENFTVKNPECIAIQPLTGKLFISCYREDKIKVFNIST